MSEKVPQSEPAEILATPPPASSSLPPTKSAGFIEPSFTHQINLRLTIRPAKFSDLWPAAQGLNRAFAKDPLFANIIHPYLDQHPDDAALWFYDALREDWFDWTTFYLVAVGRKKDGSEVIAGTAQWRRKGDWRDIRKWGWGLPWWDLRNLIQPIYKFLLRLQSYLPPPFRQPNLAADPSKVDILARVEPFTKHHWTGRRKSSWYLCLMGVAPEFQSHGVGRALVAWGFDRARQEGVSASVIAAYGKDHFYQKCGFEICVGNANDGPGNPLGELGCEGGNIWFWDWQKGSDKEVQNGGGKGKEEQR